MRHLVSGRKLNRTASHRRAMLSNLAVSILDRERVTTTVAKAKEVRGVVERLITYGKQGDLHAIRMAARRVNDEGVLKKLFEDIAPSYKEREGGYTRILKTEDRKGDCAPMAIIELVGRSGHNDLVRKRTVKKKKAAASRAKKPAVAAPAAVEEATAAVEAVEAVETTEVAPSAAEEAVTTEAAVVEDTAAPSVEEKAATVDADAPSESETKN